ncbi:hypothetical protein HPB49_010606 [Dermacentor silvarum]|uniref:Uncharacterized protein n=1 Tax=Dermacentor silvarum TaxID=543639 RepID=A0ACB8DCL6_DERSI|nr:hypothetical protein HPB49_010606 [Dermacentor silvarum]
MAEPEVLTALREQVQQLQQELQTQQQQHSHNASTTEAAPAGSAEDVTAPTEGIPHAASYDTWRVAVKLPPFWVDSPRPVHPHASRKTGPARITSSPLDALYADEVRNILANPPTANLYERLKTALIRRLSLSEEQKLRQLQSAELAERKPSQLLRHMRVLAGNMQVEDSFLRALWLQRLPPPVQAILQAQVRLPLDELAEIADRLSPTIQAVAAPLNTTELARRIDDIDQQLTSVQQRLATTLTPLRRGNLITAARVTTTDASETEPGNVDHPVPWICGKRHGSS